MLTTAQGGASSDSYATVRQANDYLRRVYGADNLGTWAELSEFQVELRLRLAALMIGALPLRGRKSYRTQALDFPRYLANDSRYDWRRVPGAVVEAQILIAYILEHRAFVSQSSPDDGVSAGRVEEVSLSGLLQVKFADGPVSGGTLLGSIIRSPESPVYALLKPFMTQVRIFRSKASEERALDYYPAYTTTTTLVPPTTTTTETLAPTTTTAAPTTTTSA